MVSLNQRLLDDAIRHGIQLERFKTGEVRRLVAFLNRDVLPDLIARVESRLSRIASRGFDSGAWTTQRYRDMLDQVRAVLRDAVRELNRRSRESLVGLARKEADLGVARIAAASPVNLGVTVPDSATLRAVVTSRPFEGALLREWWGGLASSTADRVDREIRIGITQGEGVDQIVRRLRGTKAASYSDGVLETTRREAEAVVRTAVAHVSAQAREVTWDENADLIKGVQWVATLDTRTCPVCMGLDGEVFGVEEDRRPPAHWNCRCTTIPVLKSWKELGISLADAPPGTRASLDGQVPATMTYGEWLRAQDRERQDDALGPARARLFRSGDLRIDEFSDDRGRILTLEELGV